MPFTITSYRARQPLGEHYRGNRSNQSIVCWSTNRRKRKKEKKNEKQRDVHWPSRVNCFTTMDNSIRAREQALFSFGHGILCKYSCTPLKIMYTVTLVLTTLFSVASKSPCWPKNLTTRTIFFHVTPFNGVISPGAVFPDTSGGGPIMQMYEVKRPGPSYDRSETTPARAPAGVVCIVNRRGRAVEHRTLPPEKETQDASLIRVCLARIYTGACIRACSLKRRGNCIRLNTRGFNRPSKTKHRNAEPIC